MNSSQKLIYYLRGNTAWEKKLASLREKSGKAGKLANHSSLKEIFPMIH